MRAKGRILTIAVTAAVAALLTGATGSRADTSATCLGEAATIVGTDGDDTIAGTKNDDVIVALAGNDVISGFAGDDLICAGEGNDRIIGGGGLGDAIEAGPGDDWIGGGGAGITLVAYHEAPGPVTVDLAAGTATGDGTDTLVRVNSVLGSEYDDVIAGTDGLNFVLGGAGNDRINARGSFDFVSGDAGDDILDGGTGRDSVSYFESPHGVSVNLSAGRATGWGSDRLLHVEDVDGSKYADRITGAWDSNELDGNGGADRLVGLGSNDTLRGNTGRDFADGGRGRDRCSAEKKIRCP